MTIKLHVIANLLVPKEKISCSVNHLSFFKIVAISFNEPSPFKKILNE